MSEPGRDPDDVAAGRDADRARRPGPSRRDDEATTGEALYERVRQDLERERGPAAWLRSRPTPQRLALWLLSAAVVSLVLQRMAGGAGAEPARLLSLVTLGATTAIAMGVALWPLPRHRPSGRARLLLVVGVAAAALAALVLAGDGTLGPVGPLRCVRVGAVAALPVFGVGLLLDRQPSRGLLLSALAAALAGALAVQGVCGASGLTHLVVSHFGAVVAATVGFVTIGSLGRALLSRATR
ncbi:MAG: hypothetical protein ACFCGT_00520 [Sandaracinaceae bacterium]